MPSLDLNSFIKNKNQITATSMGPPSVQSRGSSRRPSAVDGPQETVKSGSRGTSRGSRSSSKENETRVDSRALSIPQRQGRTVPQDLYVNPTEKGEQGSREPIFVKNGSQGQVNPRVKFEEQQIYREVGDMFDDTQYDETNSEESTVFVQDSQPKFHRDLNGAPYDAHDDQLENEPIHYIDSGTRWETGRDGLQYAYEARPSGQAPNDATKEDTGDRETSKTMHVSSDSDESDEDQLPDQEADPTLTSAQLQSQMVFKPAKDQGDTVERQGRSDQTPLVHMEQLDSTSQRRHYRNPVVEEGVVSAAKYGASSLESSEGGDPEMPASGKNGVESQQFGHLDTFLSKNVAHSPGRGRRSIKIAPEQGTPIIHSSAAKAGISLEPGVKDVTSRKRKHEQELDYTPEALSKMSYSELASQPFDSNPNSLPHSIGTSDMPLTQKLKAVSSQNSDDQTAFFSSLSINEWEDCGDCFASQFADILKRMKESRQAKRKVIAEFEREIGERSEMVKRNIEGVKGALGAMRAQGMGLLGGSTPKKP
jgi:Extracellular mutant protein 11